MKLLVLHKLRGFISDLGSYCNDHSTYKAPYTIYLLLCKIAY